MLKGLRAVIVHAREVFTDGQDQVSKVLRRVFAGVQRPFFDLLPERMADCIIKQSIFILKVRLKRDAVDVCPVSYVLH